MPEENKKKGRHPDYKGDGVAVWVNSKDDKTKYLSIKVLGSINLVAWKYEPKQEKQSEL
ncbi:MAG: hypothetical protein ABIB47_02310 [Candidatus Woesearchaeota archaeon]